MNARTKEYFLAALMVLSLSLLFAVPPALAQQCDPTGAHAKHAAHECKTCHVVGGVECFDPAGSAYSVYLPAPFFDSMSRTCSNVACHSVLPGTYSYYSMGGDGEGMLNTVHYGSTAANTTPSWYEAPASCTPCHGNPPRYGSDGSNVWHSGFHANNSFSGSNDCQLCHPDASGTGGVGTTITDPTLHVNGAVNVAARFRTLCFNCH